MKPQPGPRGRTAQDTRGAETSREAGFVTTRTAKRGFYSRRMGLVAAAMGVISFALGYLTHPM
jgi:hypothetical protein